MAYPQRGEIWNADLDPVRGHEQAGKRPVLVLSADTFNAGPADLVVILPLTSKIKGIPLHVSVAAGEGGLRANSQIMCEMVRSVAKQRLTKRLGSVSAATLAKVENLVRILLDL